MKFEMTNEELAQAIEQAHQLTRTTGPQSPVLKATHDHFMALLEVQKARAAMITIEGSNVLHNRRPQGVRVDGWVSRLSQKRNEHE